MIVQNIFILLCIFSQIFQHLNPRFTPPHFYRFTIYFQVFFRVFFSLFSIPFCHKFEWFFKRKLPSKFRKFSPFFHAIFIWNFSKNKTKKARISLDIRALKRSISKVISPPQTQHPQAAPSTRHHPVRRHSAALPAVPAPPAAVHRYPAKQPAKRYSTLQ